MNRPTVELEYDVTREDWLVVTQEADNPCGCDGEDNNDALCRPCRAREILNDAARFAGGE